MQPNPILFIAIMIVYTSHNYCDFGPFIIWILDTYKCQLYLFIRNLVYPYFEWLFHPLWVSFGPHHLRCGLEWWLVQRCIMLLWCICVRLYLFSLASWFMCIGRDHKAETNWWHFIHCLSTIAEPVFCYCLYLWCNTRAGDAEPMFSALWQPILLRSTLAVDGSIRRISFFWTNGSFFIASTDIPCIRSRADS